WLVDVAPDTALMLALWSASTSLRSMGMTWLASCCEYCSAVLMTGTLTSVMRPPLTVTLAFSSPEPYCSLTPVTLLAAVGRKARGPATGAAGEAAEPDAEASGPAAEVPRPLLAVWFPAATSPFVVPDPWKPSTPRNPATVPARTSHGAVIFMRVLPGIRGRMPRGGWRRPGRPGSPRHRQWQRRTPRARTRTRRAGSGRGRAGEGMPHRWRPAPWGRPARGSRRAGAARVR